MTTSSGGITLEYLMYLGLLSTSAGGFVHLGKHLESLDEKGQRQSTISTAAVVGPTISTLALMGCQNHQLDKQERAMTTSAYIEQMSDEDLEAALSKIGEREANQEKNEDIKGL